jgi:hypothetical protein
LSDRLSNTLVRKARSAACSSSSIE